MSLRLPALTAVFLVAPLVALTGPSPSNVLLSSSHESDKIPAFARKYRTSCLTCHVMPPRLNAFGEAFRLNGYEMPRGDAAMVRDSAVPLGAPGWEELFPEAVWPGAIPGSPPIAARLIVDYERRRGATNSFRFPALLQVLMGGTLGEDIGFFVETSLSSGSGVGVSQAFLKFQDVLEFAGLPDRTFNIWIGKFDQNYLPSYRPLENLYRAQPLWATAGIGELRVDSAGTDRTSATQFRPAERQPAVELNGLLAGRVEYAIGVAQGVDATTDVDDHKDVYYRTRLKLGGRGLDGSIGAEGARGVQPGWVDNALQVEHFGYFGRQADDPFRRFGVALRAGRGDLDAAVGYVWGTHDRPWLSGSGAATLETWYGRADYFVWPWLIVSARIEDLSISPALPPAWQVSPGGARDLQRVVPAVVMLVRANIRLVLEAELYSRDAAETERRHALAGRLDVAF